MPATYTATNGTAYPLWQGRCLVRNASTSIGFSEFENDLGDCYYSQLLYGSQAGNRRWSITMPTLQDGLVSTTYTGVGGTTLTAAKYVMDLFGHCKRTGQPFVYQDPLTDHYYFARFADKELTYERALSKLYSSGVQIKQARIPGVSVFDPSTVSYLWAHYDPAVYDEGVSWPDSTDNANHLETVTGDVQAVPNSKNGQAIVRLNALTDDGFLSSTKDVTVYDFIAVLKMREDTFSNFAGICSGDDSEILVGDETETRFFYFAQNNVGGQLSYWKNTVEYDFADQQAPMNAWGIVHTRFETDGVPIANIRLGRHRALAGRFAKVDLGDVCIADQLIPMDIVSEIIEHLAAKWRINVT